MKAPHQRGQGKDRTAESLSWQLLTCISQEAVSMTETITSCDLHQGFPSMTLYESINFR